MDTVDETVTVNQESRSIMEVVTPPPIISPLISPVKPPKKSSSVTLFLDEPNSWPQELSSGNDFSCYVVISGNDEKSATASLQRTLKKCNIRSINPRYRQSTREGFFGYQINVHQLHTTLRKIETNWISIQNSQLYNFCLEGFIIKLKNVHY